MSKLSQGGHTCQSVSALNTYSDLRELSSSVVVPEANSGDVLYISH